MAQLQFTVVDPHGGTSNEQTLTLKISGDNDAPDAVDDTITQVITHDVDVTPAHAAINLGNDSDFDLSTGFTISQKVNVTGAGIVFNKENSYEVAVFGDGSVRYALQGPHSGWVWNDTGYKLPFNETHVLTAAYDGPNQNFAIYVDGQEVFSGSRNVPTSLRQQPGNDLLFGERGSNNQPIEGTFDDIQIYSQALSASEIADIADGKTVGHDLVACYTFETSTPLADLSGNGHTATLQNGATVVEHTGNPTEDVPFTIKATDILANDSDIDSNHFDLISVQGATHGTVSLDSDGNVYFVPEKDYSGPASFTYTIQDNSGDASSDKATATVNFTIDPVNDAPVAVDHADAFHEDNIVLDNSDGTVDGKIQGSINLLTGVTDVDDPSGPFEIGAVEGSTARVGHPYYVTFNFHNSNTGQEDFVKANVTINADGSYTIDQTDINKMPQDDVAVGTIEYQVKDPNGALSVGKKLTITITGDNDAPDAVDDSQIGDLNTVVDVTPAHAAVNVGKMNDITDAFTISQDIKVTGSGIVFNKENTYEVAVESDGSLRYAMRDASGQGWVWNDTGYDLPLNTDVNLTVVYDGSAQELRFYVDGTRVVTSTANVGSALTTYYSGNDLLFGERGSNNQPIEGTFDNILVYKTALSDAEVATIASGGDVANGILGKYDFEGANPLDDKSGNGNDATLQNGATLVQNFGGNLHDIETDEDTPLTFDAAKLLINDSDVDLDPIHVVSVAATADTHGTVSYDSNTGQITYTPDPDFNGIAKFDYTIEDSHGAHDTATVTVKVDATPDLQPDTKDLKEGDSTVTDNVLANDDAGTPTGTVTSFQYIDTNGVNQTATVPAGGSVQVTTQYGTLTMHSDGNYDYLPATQLNHPGDGNTAAASFADIITYVVTDGNSDTASTTLTVNVGDTIATVNPAVANTVDEDDLPQGSDTSKESLITPATSLAITAGKDSITDVKFDLTKVQNDAGMQALKSDGQVLTFSLNGDHQLIAKDHAGNDIFVVTINDDGSGHYNENSTYTFELKGVLDHDAPPGGTARDENQLDVNVPFSVIETDDVIDGNVLVKVTDDVPTAVNDADQSIVEGSIGTLGGNLITDATTPDIKGADGAKIASIRLDGTTNDIDISDGNDHTITTPTGTLTVNADGTWSFTPVASFDHDDHLSGDASDSATNGSFSYILKDFDGDTSLGHQAIDVTDGAAPTIDNSNNVLVKVYEGGVHSTFDGTSNYDRADDINDDADPGNDQMTSTPTLTHKLDFSLGSDSAGITEVTWEGHTQTLNKDTATASDFIIIDTTGDATNKGILKVYYDGRWEYTSPDAYIHPNPPTPPGFDVNNFQTTFTYKVEDIDNDTAAVTGSQTIQVDDTFATIDSTTDVTLDEKNLPTGTDPDPALTTQTGTITVDASKLGGSYDIQFDTTQTDNTWTATDGTNTPGLSSNGKTVEYQVVNNGHTLQAVTDKGTASETVIFDVQITDPDGTLGTGPGYVATLYHDLDHETALLENGNLEFDFSITLTDDDGDKSPSTFKVSIVDDSNVPTTDTLVVNEEGVTGAHDTSIPMPMPHLPTQSSQRREPMDMRKYWQMDDSNIHRVSTGPTRKIQTSVVRTRCNTPIRMQMGSLTLPM